MENCKCIGLAPFPSAQKYQVHIFHRMECNGTRTELQDEQLLCRFLVTLVGPSVLQNHNWCLWAPGITNYLHPNIDVFLWVQARITSTLLNIN